MSRPAGPGPAARRWLRARAWYLQRRPVEAGGHAFGLLRGAAAYVPDLVAAVQAARRSVGLATYIFEDPGLDPAAAAVAQALAEAARRGLKVRVVVDGFGSRLALPGLRAVLEPAGVELVVFRPLDGWWHWLQPRQLRRLHQKLAVVDERLAWCGGINLIDDRHDQHHGWTEAPRLDYALRIEGPAVGPIAQTIGAVWQRARFGADWRDQLAAWWRQPQPVEAARRWRRRLRWPTGAGPTPSQPGPGRAAFVLRDNLRQRRTIERAYLEALGRARESIDLVCPYFYPGRALRRALGAAAARGVRVRLLLQGKVDLAIAGHAARSLYARLQAQGVQVHEYTPAFLHAKLAVVDGDWATVGSSNIDPLSLLLNLEANLVVRDPALVATLRAALARDFAAARLVPPQAPQAGWRAALGRGALRVLVRLYLAFGRGQGQE